MSFRNRADVLLGYAQYWNETMGGVQTDDELESLLLSLRIVLTEKSHPDFDDAIPPA